MVGSSCRSTNSTIMPLGNVFSTTGTFWANRDAPTPKVTATSSSLVFSQCRRAFIMCGKLFLEPQGRSKPAKYSCVNDRALGVLVDSENLESFYRLTCCIKGKWCL